MISEKDYRFATFVAMTVIGLWLLHLLFILTAQLSLANTLLHIMLQTFLTTGLFITAHDSMHGLVDRKNKRLNDALGALALFIYGGFSYTKLRQAHIQHHKDPASKNDPDFTSHKGESFWPWLFEFGRRYYGWREFLIMHLHVFLVWAIGGAIWKVFVFFALPAWLSALQLFYFGTYLPHRSKGKTTNDNRHRARSNDYPVWISFLTCYHFGYHFEHHEFPHAPWWTLPRFRASRKYFG